MSLASHLVLAFYSGRIKAMERMATQAQAMQEQQLSRLVARARNTQFGQEHGFDKIKTYADFVQAVPVTDYEHFAPYVERMLRAEANVTWPGRVKWFAKSSGTSDAKSKFIPVTDDVLSQCHMQGNKDCIAAYYHQHPETQCHRGLCLTLGGSKKISPLGNGLSQTGDLSAIMIGNAPFWSNWFKTPTKDVALIAEWEDKLEKITAQTVHQNVTSLAGVPSWFMVLLKHIMAHEGKQNIQEVWPNLELFIHGGINFEPYREQYKAIAPKGLNFLETYNASEGFFALQTDPTNRGLQLMLDLGVFFEFVPLAEVGQEHPAGAVPIWGVSTGVDYAIVITTCGGLWRYMIGDTVRFTETAPYKIVISGRTKLYINAFGEELMIGNAEEAIRRACKATGAVVSDYTAAPVFMDAAQRGCHQWLVEFQTPPADPEAFGRELDLALQAVNSDYEAKRYKDITLAPLILTVARPNLFVDWLRSHGKLGGQNKVPRLKNDRALIDEMLQMNAQQQ